MPERNWDKQVDRLDGILPESIDRRAFFKTAVGTTMSGLLAGCLGGNQTTPTATPGADKIVKNVVMRSAWKAEPNYAIGYAADLRGHWADQNIGGISYRKGFGSGDATKRVGTGKEMFGMASITPQVPGLAQGFNLKIFGTGKARTQLALLYRKDRISDPQNLNDVTVVTESALAEQAWPVYKANIESSNLNMEFAEEAGAVSLVAEGKADAIWGTIDDLGPFQAAMPSDVEVDGEPLYSVLPVYGYTLIVNGDFLSESDENREYTKRVLQGYSQAGKWVLLNPDKAVTMMRQDVNQALQATDKEQLLDNLKAGVAATNLTEGVKNNGVGYLDKEVLQNSFDGLGGALGVDSPPSADEAGAFGIQDDAELATFSSSEWSQIEEFAQPYAGMF